MPLSASRRQQHSASPKINQSSRRSEKFDSGRDNPAIRARLDAGEGVRGDEMSHLVHSTLMETLERLGREHNLPVVDFISVVDQHPEFFASCVHLTEEANARLAELLFEVLTASP